MSTQPPFGAQEMPLLRTKLSIPPIRRELVPRPPLIERLSAGIHHKLALISAPAGFGKTTLVSEWIAAHHLLEPSVHVAWLSLDESDNDLTCFLTYFVAALQTLALRSDGTSDVKASEPSTLTETVLRPESAAQEQPAGLIGRGVLSALHSPQPPPVEAILTALVNELASVSGRVVLVLDDYHLIVDQPVHDALTFLLRHLPSGVHLVIATREDPPLPLARLRARGQLTEVRAVDLRFSSSEAAQFLNHVMGLDLSAEDVGALERRTEGWIAGLQLAALAMQGTSLQGRSDAAGFIQSFTGSHHFVLDYLVEEVLDGQTETVQDFLLQTCVLDRLSGPLCDAVRFGEDESPRSSEGSPGLRDSQAMLEMLDHANLFIVPLDDQLQWYRYHHLFADLLRRRLHQTQPEQAPTLHRRASDWFVRNQLIDEAIEHALRAEDLERAARLIEERVDALWQRGEHAKLRRWLFGLPEHLLLAKPQLCILYAWYLFARGQQDVAERYLGAAEEALGERTPGDGSEHSTEGAPVERGPPLTDTDRERLRGRAAAIRAALSSYRGDVPGIVEHARRALAQLPERDLVWRSLSAVALGNAHGFRGDMASALRARLTALETSKRAGNSYYSVLAHLEVAITLREQGRLQASANICRQQLQLAEDIGLSQASLAGCLMSIWGEVLAEQGELEQASRLAKAGVERTKGADLAMLGWSYLCLERVMFSAGDLSAATELVRKIERATRESAVPAWIVSQMAAWQARIRLSQGQLEAASQWARERALTGDGEPQPAQFLDYFTLIEHVVLARILMAQERLDQAGDLLQRLLTAAETGDRATRVIEILSLQALASQAGGDTPRAMAALQRALALAESGGFFQVFVDEGPPMGLLLHEAASRGIAPDYAGRLLAAFPSTQPPSSALPVPDVPPPSPVVEPLSEREIEILELIAEGLTNSEVAATLYLALNTVKAHTRNIYGKLDVHSRTQAIARARQLGLIPRT